jgi:hypothetical protein
MFRSDYYTLVHENGCIESDIFSMKSELDLNLHSG